MSNAIGVPTSVQKARAEIIRKLKRKELVKLGAKIANALSALPDGFQTVSAVQKLGEGLEALRSEIDSI